jgi:two-component system catabolic regulation response regulator CreB
MTAGARRIVVVEDEPAIADTLVYALRTEGFRPEWCASGRDGFAALEREPAALVILDVGLPDANGFDLCRELQRRWPTPVLFLTARNAEVDRIVGLELGADDYVTKPFSPREVTARVKAILRRAEAPPPGLPAATPDTLSADNLVVDGERCEARLGGAAVPLTRYEFRLLRVLQARPGRVYSRDDLMMLVWEDPGASLDRTVDAHIKTLRSKLRTAAGDDTFDPIRTHRGLGYSFRSDP